MNPHTGHLVNIGDDETMLRRLGDHYERLPKELEAAAAKELGGNAETRVNLRGTSPLAAWAKKKRREKIAAKSRRANRK